MQRGVKSNKKSRKQASQKLARSQKTTKHHKPHTSSGARVVFRRGINGTDGILFDGKPQIAFVGRSNVGKSSTINAILGAVVARTSSTPGKTQEINFFEVSKRPKTAEGEGRSSEGRTGPSGYFVDLPGYGYARMSVPAQEKIRKHILWYLTGGEAKPRMLVLILDARVGITEYDRELIEVAREREYPLLILANKIDKLSGSERAKQLAEIVAEYPDADIIQFSASKKENLTLVRTLLFQALGIRA